ncbi:hypothetical protein AB6H29_16380 [Providencia hangzhouensis]|uniref:hypothetical protein n=1 Tax=Providencia hangzhouensis TaxID=3031799 RepID=UPI0034DD4522
MNIISHLFQIGEKTTKNITCLLENLSVGQVFYIISKTVTDAFIYHQKKSTKINKGQAANSVVDAMKRMHERYLANGWSVYSKYGLVIALNRYFVRFYLYLSCKQMMVVFINR